jgi:hypothetical protein
MNLIDKRAIKIVQLQEELEEAKKIITDFVWPGDGTKESRQRFEQKAARFAGCTVPIFGGEPERSNSLANTKIEDAALLDDAADECCPPAKPIQYTGHVPCKKCGTTHWMHGPCPQNIKIEDA